eukprot:RCo012786
MLTDALDTLMSEAEDRLPHQTASHHPSAVTAVSEKLSKQQDSLEQYMNSREPKKPARAGKSAIPARPSSGERDHHPSPPANPSSTSVAKPNAPNQPKVHRLPWESDPPSASAAPAAAGRYSNVVGS